MYVHISHFRRTLYTFLPLGVCKEQSKIFQMKLNVDDKKLIFCLTMQTIRRESKTQTRTILNYCDNHHQSTKHTPSWMIGCITKFKHL